MRTNKTLGHDPMRLLIGIAISSFALLMMSTQAHGQTPGSLDQNFDTDGKATVSFNTANDRAYALAVRWNNDIYVVGTNELSNQVWNERMAITRIKPDGSLDPDFGNAGTVIQPITSHTRAYGCAREDAGKLIVTGHTGLNPSSHQMVTARINFTDGSVDNTFGSSGYVTTQFVTGKNARGWDVAIQPDGKILVAGWSKVNTTPERDNFAIARFNTDGTLDNTFSSDGKLLIDFGNGDAFAHKVRVMPNGKIVVIGTYRTSANSAFAVARLNANGTLDNTFGNQGKAMIFMPANTTTTDAWDGIVDAQGRVVVVGFAGVSSSMTKPAMARFATNGTPDISFGPNGRRVFDPPGIDGGGFYGIQQQADLRYVCVGYTAFSPTNEDFLLALVKENGTLDTQFGFNGYVTTTFGSSNERARDVALQEINGENLITVAGHAKPSASASEVFAIARYYPRLTVGIVDFDQPVNQLLVYPNPITEATTLTYTLQDSEQLTIALFDLQGRQVTTFLDGQWMPAGEHRQPIALPADVAPGSYLLVLSSPKGRMAIQVVK